MQKIRSIKMADRESLEIMAKIRGISLTPETLHKVLDRPLEEYECPSCGRDCGQKVKGEVGTCWHFYCEYCGIDFGGDL